MRAAVARRLRRFDRYAPLLTIRDKAGSYRRLRLNPIQRRIIAEKRKTLEAGRPARWLHLKYRRGGVSTLLQAVSFHRCATRRGQKAVTLAHDLVSTEQIFQMVGTFYDRLPEPLRPIKSRSERRELHFPGMDSRFYIGTAGSGGFGRGDTLQRVHWSEVAWSTRATAGLLVGLTEAATHGAIDLETTANGQSGIFYELYKAAKEGWSEWTPLFFPWFIDPELAVDPGKLKIIPGVPHRDDFPEEFCAGELELIEMAERDYNVRISPAQILWRRRKWSGTQPNTDLFAQEYPETWQGAFVASSDLFFDQRLLKLGEMMAEPPQHKEDGDRFHAWEEPRPGAQYIAAADTSLGVKGGDAQYLTIHERESRRQVARWRGWVSPKAYGGVVIPKFCRRYNSAEVAIERNNHGHAVIVAAENAGYGRKLWRVPEKYQQAGRSENVVGWDTNSATRDLGLDNLRGAMEDGSLHVRDPLFWSECYTFTRADGKRERYEAPAGKKDDSILAMMILHEVCRITPRPRFR